VTGSAGSEVTVDRLLPDEIDVAARLLARSFLDEPFFAYIFEGKDPGRIERATTPWFRAFIRTFLPYGEIHAARVEGRLVGVGVRTPPESYPLKGRANVALVLRIMRALLPMIATAPRARQMLRVPGALAKVEPHEPHLGLQWVGVDPAVRGLGVGSRLADEAVSVADATGTPAFLITFGPKTRALYERRGFIVQEGFSPVPGGPEGWAMYRRGPPSSS